MWQGLYDELGEKGFVPITVALDASPDAARPYIEKAQRRESVAKLADDRYGPFTVAAAAEKGDDGGKIVVISSRDCMVDQVAMAPAMTLTSQGIVMRQRNPGNIALFLNALRWLNGQTEWMAVGIPVDVGTIEIEEGPALSFIKVFVGGLWPATALACGVVAWWVRRR